MNKIKFINHKISFVLLGLLIPLFSFADSDDVVCKAYASKDRLPVNELQKKLVNQGYVILEFDYEHNCYEMEVVEPKGKKAKIYFDAKTGAQVERKADLF